MTGGKNGTQVKIGFITPGGRAKPLAERTLAEVNWALARRSFAFTDELNEYLERAMAGEGLLRPEELSPEQKAQTLVCDAWEAKSGKERVELARRALELWPECADAYAILAEEEAKSPEEAKDLYERGVRAAEADLGRGGVPEGRGPLLEGPADQSLHAGQGLSNLQLAGAHKGSSVCWEAKAKILSERPLVARR